MTFKIFTTIDESGAQAAGSHGWAHGRLVAAGTAARKWVEIQYRSRESAQRALNGPQFTGRGAYATDGEITLTPQN